MGFPKIYPFVSLIVHPTLFARAKFGPGGPKGITIHYTADPTVEGTLKSFGANGYCYHLIIDRDGKVTQSCYFEAGTWHAGKAEWAGQSPNRMHIAVALVGWGWLKPDGHGGFKSWAETPVPAAEVAQRPDNLTGEVGAWHACTPVQEQALEQVLLWCMANGIGAGDICGHDEAALPKGRKFDPGGALSRTMPELRAHLASIAGPKTAS